MDCSRREDQTPLSFAVAALWPSAPTREAGYSGRWVRFDHPEGGALYLQRYAWDEPCVPHFLVVRCGPDHPLDQRRFSSLADAVRAIRTALAELPALQRTDDPAPAA
jgi:hypothetical protein